MAKTYVAPKAGSVSLPTGFNADFQNFEAEESQPFEEITNWTTGNYRWNLGTGVEASAFTCFGFAFKGNGVNASNPGFGVMTGAGGNVGGTATFGMDIGASVSGVYIVHNLRYLESRIQAAAKCTYQLVTGPADPTVTWAT